VKWPNDCCFETEKEKLGRDSDGEMATRSQRVGAVCDVGDRIKTWSQEKFPGEAGGLNADFRAQKEDAGYIRGWRFLVEVAEAKFEDRLQIRFLAGKAGRPGVMWLQRFEWFRALRKWEAPGEVWIQGGREPFCGKHDE